MPYVSAASYAVVRTAVLPAPAEPPDAVRFRGLAGRISGLVGWCAQAAPELEEQLHGLIGAADPRVRGRVLIPLRRDVHNGRTPKAAVLAAVASAPDLLGVSPLLARWLAARAEIDALGAELDAAAPAALRADREVLGRLCADEHFGRAVALTSEDLLRAVERAAAQGGAPDDRARKSEPTVLRYAMRGIAKTTPLSWFGTVGWGRWVAGLDDSDTEAGEPTATTQADRTALEALVRGVMEHIEPRTALAHTLAPGLYVDGASVRFRRPSATKPGAGLVREEEVRMPLTGPVRRLLARAAADGVVHPEAFADELAAALPVAADQAGEKARHYVRGLIDNGLLVPAYPLDPQSTDGLRDATGWLVDVGRADLAAILAEINVMTRQFARIGAADRPAALARLRARWSDAFTHAQTAPAGRRVPVTEDVAVRGGVRLGADRGGRALADLARLAPLFEVFDQYTVLRRAARDRFVARFGRAGRCAAPAEFASEYAAIWQATEQLHVDGSIEPELDDALRASGESAGDGLRALARLRTELCAAVARIASATATADAVDAVDRDEVVLTDEIVDGAARGLPSWMRARPASYCVFTQAVPGVAGANARGQGRPADSTGLCVNRVYGGWGRFTSRFLGLVDPAARAEVAARIEQELGPGARVAQMRPVNGFNANLHPRVVRDEIAQDPALGTLTLGDLHLAHDPESDQLRVVVTATGEPLDVLYLGFLIEAALPSRLMPLVTDLASGLVDHPAALTPWRHRETPLGPISFRPRLRYRGVALSRAQWRLSAQLAGQWRAESDHEQGPAARTAARWRALLGLPERVFIGAAPADGAAGLAGLMSYFDQPKSQYTDFGSALHLRSLSRTLGRYEHGVIVEEALPAPGPGRRAVETAIEIHRRSS